MQIELSWIVSSVVTKPSLSYHLAKASFVLSLPCWARMVLISFESQNKKLTGEKKNSVHKINDKIGAEKIATASWKLCTHIRKKNCATPNSASGWADSIEPCTSICKLVCGTLFLKYIILSWPAATIIGWKFNIATYLYITDSAIQRNISS